MFFSMLWMIWPELFIFDKVYKCCIEIIGESSIWMIDADWFFIGYELQNYTHCNQLHPIDSRVVNLYLIIIYLIYPFINAQLKWFFCSCQICLIIALVLVLWQIIKTLKVILVLFILGLVRELWNNFLLVIKENSHWGEKISLGASDCGTFPFTVTAFESM